MGLNLDASPEELKIFLEEVEEHLQSLEEDLVKLEKEENTEELLQEIFRSAHTLKGSSATLGHNRMAQLTHAMENVLDKLRKGQLAICSDIIDVLFEGLDILRILKDEIVNDEESDVDFTELVNKLTNVSGDSGNLVSTPQKVKAEVIDAEEQTTTANEEPDKDKIEVNWEEQKKVQEGIGSGKRPVLVNIDFESNGEMLPVRFFITMMTLRELGDIVKSEPTEEQIENEQVGTQLKVLLLTNEKDEVILGKLKELPDILAVKILPFSDEQQVDSNQQKNENKAPETDKVKPEKPSAAKSPAKSSAKPANLKSGRTVRVDVELLDNLMNLVGELVIDRTRLFQILTKAEQLEQIDEVSQEMGRTSIHIGRVTTQLQEQIMKARMLPVESLFNKFPRLMRDLGHKAGKEFEFIMEGQETELDRSIIEEIGDPLIHLLRNSVDHGLEPPEERVEIGKPKGGIVVLKASHEENHIIITVRDDGKGMDPEKIKASAVRKNLITEEQAKRMTEKDAINLIFASGLSTAEKVTDVSGRGVGMDVVRTNIEKINGTIEINSVIGQGTEFKIKLPLTLAIIRALMVSLGKNVYAIPLTSVIETIRMERQSIEKVNNKDVIVVRGKVLPLLHLDELFRVKNKSEQSDKVFVVVVNLAGEQMGIVVDSLVGEQEIVIKSLGKYIGDVQGISGATILGDGNVALIIDVANLVQKAVS